MPVGEHYEAERGLGGSLVKQQHRVVDTEAAHVALGRLGGATVGGHKTCNLGARYEAGCRGRGIAGAEDIESEVAGADVDEVLISRSGVVVAVGGCGASGRHVAIGTLRAVVAERDEHAELDGPFGTHREHGRRRTVRAGERIGRACCGEQQHQYRQYDFIYAVH